LKSNLQFLEAIRFCSDQFKMVSMRSENPICAPAYFSDLF